MTAEKRKLLIVDDDVGHCELVTAWLSDRFAVSAAYDGETGVDLARRELPDLILLDIMLPKFSGFSLAWVFKHDPRYSGTAVVFVTGVNVNERALATVDGYLRKPYQRSELTALIERVMARRRPSPSAHFVDVRREPGASRRRSPRVDVTIPATLEVSGRMLRGAILSLSPWGAFFATDDPVPFDRGGRVRFSDDLASFELETYPLYKSRQRGSEGVGLRIHSRELETEHRLNEFIERRLPPQGPIPRLSRQDLSS